MAIKRSSKISTSFSSSSMTDLVFLLLVFFVLATTLIDPINAMQVSIPTSDTNKTKNTATADIKLVHGDEGVTYKLNNNVECASIDELGAALDGYYNVSMNSDNNMVGSNDVTMNVTFICDKDATSMQQFVDVASKIQLMNAESQKKSPEKFPKGVDKYKLSIATREN